ncbi:MAG: SemiSWEET family sugar transporter [Salinivirgaceae bacterium]|nr:SemiSWEET family sugar transporter [Salinivirgaceae bacterium]
MEPIEIVGYIAAVLTTISFVPQAAKIIKTKDTKSISLVMYALFSIGVLCWLIYGIVTRTLPVVLANGITLCFASVILAYKIKYK